MQRNWILVNQHCAAFLKLNAKDYRLWGVKLCLAVKQQLDDAVIGMLALCIDDDRRNNVAGPFLVCLNLVESGATGGGKASNGHMPTITTRCWIARLISARTAGSARYLVRRSSNSSAETRQGRTRSERRLSNTRTDLTRKR